MRLEASSHMPAGEVKELKTRLLIGSAITRKYLDCVQHWPYLKLVRICYCILSHAYVCGFNRLPLLDDPHSPNRLSSDLSYRDPQRLFPLPICLSLQLFFSSLPSQGGGEASKPPAIQLRWCSERASERVG